MSLRHLFNSSGLLIVLGVAIGMSSQANASNNSTVQTYTDQAVPLDSPPSEAFQNAPLPAGSLTMDDVLKAHAPKEKAEPPSVPVATGLMMSQGMNSVFQKYKVPVTKPPRAAPVAAKPQPQEELEKTAPPAAGETQLEAAAKPATPETPASLAFEPGRAPKTLEAPAESTSAPAEKPAPSEKAEIVYASGHAPKDLAAAAPAETPSPAAPRADCTDKVQKREKNCVEAGYPETYVGKVFGETRSTCADSSLQDVWIKNTCVPPEEAPAPAKTASVKKVAAEKTEEKFLRTPASAPVPEPAPKKEAAAAAPEKTAAAPAPSIPAPASTNPEELCGEAAETLAYEAPEKNLCRIGSASPIKGNGPWSWTCTNNSGAVSSCRTLSLSGTVEVAEAEEPASPASAPASPVSSSSKDSEKSRFLQMPAKKAAAVQVAAAPEPEVPVACGSADNHPARTVPDTGLCESGKASAVRGSGPWRWTCVSGKKKVSCSTIKPLDGVCGNATKTAKASEPTKNLCKSGLPSSVTKAETSWTWTCAGSNSGNDIDCSAPKATETKNIPELKTPHAEIPSKKLEPSEPPEGIQITADEAPKAPPELPEESVPVPPPSVKEVPAAEKHELQKPELQEPPAAAPTPNTAQLVLDPTLSAVLFTHLSETVDPRSSTTLNKLAEVLKKNQGGRVSLIAYAEGGGLAPHAVHRLSLARALAVRNYLAAKGVSQSRIDIHAEGASAPTGYPDRVDIKVND